LQSTRLVAAVAELGSLDLMRALLLILGCLFATVLAFAAEKEPIRITDGWGVARLYGNVGSREIYHAKADDAFEFIVEEVPARELEQQRASVKTWWGADGPRPPLLVKRISFHIGGRSVAFPLQAYADLGDMFYPPRLRLEQHGRELHLFYRPRMPRPATPRLLSYGTRSSLKGLCS